MPTLQQLETSVEDSELKSVTAAQEESIQARATQEAQGRVPLLALMSHAGELISPWWSRRRDYDLNRFWKGTDHISGAFYTLISKLSGVPFMVEARDPSIAAHRRLADEYQTILEAESEFGEGWQTLLNKALLDLYTSDNGFFFEVIGGGPKDGPIKGPAVGIAHLDSRRCTRTGSTEYPVIYDDIDGKMYKLHRSRVLFRSQLPSSGADMYGVGFCWLSRCINVAQSLTDILIYKQEKLGSRPKRAIGIVKGGLDPESVQAAIGMAGSEMDSQGLRRYSKVPIIGDEAIPDADISLVDLASLPDGFDYERDVTLGMYTIALAGAVPPRWLWPATTTGATKADAMYQHVAGLTGGPGATLAMIAQMLGGPQSGVGSLSDAPRFLPPQLKITFDFQDDEQDRTSAEINKVRSEARQKNLDSGTITVRVAREQMVSDGEITTSQFNEMELDDGRLPDGMDVLTLFYSRDGQTQGLLAIDAIGDPLQVAENDAAEWTIAIDKQIRIAEDVATNAPSAPLRRKAREAIVALQKLRDLYEKPTEENADTEPMNEESENVIEDGEIQTEEPEQPAEEIAEEVEEDEDPFEDEEVKSVSQMLTAVRASIRGLWNGALDLFGFVDSMDSTLDRDLRQAFYEGAAECGIKPNELTVNELDRLREFINQQLAYVMPFARDIEENSKENGGALEPLLSRAVMWASQYDVAKTMGSGFACADRKEEWVIDPANDNCGSCLKLSGKVKRASYWDERGLIPRLNGAWYLDCHGYRCGCQRIPTDKPLSKGPLPSLP